jgi:hypothetical protein
MDHNLNQNFPLKLASLMKSLNNKCTTTMAIL